MHVQYMKSHTYRNLKFLIFFSDFHLFSRLLPYLFFNFSSLLLPSSTGSTFCSFRTSTITTGVKEKKTDLWPRWRSMASGWSYGSYLFGIYVSFLITDCMYAMERREREDTGGRHDRDLDRVEDILQIPPTYEWTVVVPTVLRLAPSTSRYLFVESLLYGVPFLLPGLTLHYLGYSFVCLYPWFQWQTSLVSFS